MFRSFFGNNNNDGDDDNVRDDVSDNDESFDEEQHPTIIEKPEKKVKKRVSFSKDEPDVKIIPRISELMERPETPAPLPSPQNDPNYEHDQFRYQFRDARRAGRIQSRGFRTFRGSNNRGLPPRYFATPRGGRGGRGHLPAPVPPPRAPVPPPRTTANDESSVVNDFITTKKPHIDGFEHMGPLKFVNFDPKQVFEKASFATAEARRTAAKNGLLLKVETKRVFKIVGLPGKSLQGEFKSEDSVPIDWNGRIRLDKKSTVATCYTLKE